MRRGKGHHALGRQRERARVRRVFWSPSPAPPPHAPPARTHLPSHPHAHARARACSPPHPHAPPLSPAPGARGHRRRGGGTVGGRPYSHVSKIRRCAGEPGCAWDVHGVGGVGGGVHGACMGAALHGGGAWGWGERCSVRVACPSGRLCRLACCASLAARWLPPCTPSTPPASHASLPPPRLPPTQGWKVQLMSESVAEAGGYKECILQIIGDRWVGPRALAGAGGYKECILCIISENPTHPCARVQGVLAPQVRVGRAPRAARARHRDLWAGAHLHRHSGHHARGG